MRQTRDCCSNSIKCGADDTEDSIDEALKDCNDRTESSCDGVEDACHQRSEGIEKRRHIGMSRLLGVLASYSDSNPENG